MAAAKRFATEQIVVKLREAEKLQAQGMSIPAKVIRDYLKNFTKKYRNKSARLQVACHLALPAIAAIEYKNANKQFKDLPGHVKNRIDAEPNGPVPSGGWFGDVGSLAREEAAQCNPGGGKDD